MFDGKKFGDDLVAIVRAYVDRQIAAARADDDVERQAIEARIAGMVERAVAALPVPAAPEPIQPDMDAIEATIAGMVERAAAALPVPAAPEPIQPDMDAIEATIAGMVERAVAALPVPAAPEPIQPDMEAIEALIAGSLERAVAAMPVPAAPEPIQPDMEAIEAHITGMVERAVAALPVPAAPEPIQPDMEAIEARITGMVERAVAALPAPTDGVGVSGAIIDRKGNLVLTLSDGQMRDLGPVVGRDVDMAAVEKAVRELVEGLPAPRDAFGFDDLSVDYDNERTITLRFVRDGHEKAFPVRMPVVLDRGVYQAERAYDVGDGVTFGGSFWIAKAPTTAKPDAGGDWRLAVKKGRDARP